jgi:hypothetical protein
MTADFVAGILAGFEDALDEVLSRVPEPWLRREVEELSAQIAGKRELLESCMARRVVQPPAERTLS